MANRFDYIQYDARSTEDQAKAKEAFKAVEKVVDALPDGRAKSLIYTHLEIAYMWVGKSIRDGQVARNPDQVQEQPSRGNE